MSKVCKECGADWTKHGKDYAYEKGTRHYCSNCSSRKNPIDLDEDIIKENVRTAKKLQAARDTSRIERKAFREHARIENAYEAYVKNIDETLKDIADKIEFQKYELIPVNQKGEVGFIQLSDLHFNELIELPHNKFDIEVASKRLMTLANEAIDTFLFRGIDNVVIALTGDLLNSSRRTDEMLSQATNRAKASVVATELLTKFFLNIANYFDVTIVNVLGNEGRVDLELSWNNDIASNNYDFSLVAMSKKIIEYAGVENVKFGEIDKYETVININGHNVLLIHDISGETKTQKGSQSLIGRYALAGVKVDCVFSGHLHATKNGFISYRSGSLPGSNEYNEHALGLISRASQNIALFGDGYRHVIAIDLQNPTCDGYDIQKDLMEYDAKSASKLIEKKVIFQVVA